MLNKGLERKKVKVIQSSSGCRLGDEQWIFTEQGVKVSRNPQCGMMFGEMEIRRMCFIKKRLYFCDPRNSASFFLNMNMRVEKDKPIHPQKT